MSAKIQGTFRKVNLALVKPEVLMEHLEGIGIKVIGTVDMTTSDGVKTLVNSYVDWVREKAKDKKFVAQMAKPDGINFIRCLDCNAFSLDDLNECPVCGSEGEGQTPSLEVVKSNSRDSQAPKVVRPVVVAQEVQLIGTVSDLDSSVKEIKKCRDRALISYHELGEALLPVYTRALYKARVDPKTKLPIYRKFDDFCAAEIGISGAQARDVMAIATGCSVEHLQEHGFQKMRVLMKVPKEQLPKMLERAKNLTTRELDQAIRKMCPGARREPLAVVGSAPHRRDTTAAGQAAAAKSKTVPAANDDGKLTVVRTVGRNEIKLMRKGGGSQVGFEEFENAVTVTYTVMGSRLIIDTKRIV